MNFTYLQRRPKRKPIPTSNIILSHNVQKVEVQKEETVKEPVIYATYSHLKSLLYSEIKSYGDLLQYVEANLDIDIKSVTYNKKLCRKNQENLTVKELEEEVENVKTIA